MNVETAKLSQDSLTYRGIQKLPDSIKNTAEKIGLFIQEHKVLIGFSIFAASLAVSAPFTLQTTVISLLTVASLRIAVRILPENAAKTLRPIAYMEPVDRGVAAIAGTIAAIVTLNPILLCIGLDIDGSQGLCNLAEDTFSYLFRKASSHKTVCQA